MGPLSVMGQAWGVVRVSPGNPFLMDRTRTMRLATADPATRTIRVSTAVPPGMLDRVLLHEAAHAAMSASGVSDLLAAVPTGILDEEAFAWFMETHGIEVLSSVIAMLGRGVCVEGTCIG